MFAKSKCLITLSRSSRYVQSRSIRKSSPIKYSAASTKGLSSKCHVDRNLSHNFNVPDSGDTDVENETIVTSEYPAQRITLQKAKLDTVVRRAEDLLGCRFHRSRSSPIGVGITPPDSPIKPHFNLLPSWLDGASALTMSRIPTLFNSGHPILKLQQTLDPDADEHALMLLSNNIQWRALIVMLVAKAFEESANTQQGSRKLAESVEARQRTLSEIAEMMHFAFGLHKTVTEINRPNSVSEIVMDGNESVMQLGNKVAILSGDLLLARTSRGLSSLKHAKVTELMSDAISDFSESEILRRKHLDFFNPVHSNSSDVFKGIAEISEKGGSNMEVPSFDSWKKRVSLDIASLVGRSCLCSTLISQTDESTNSLAFSIGHKMGLVIQAYSDLELFVRGKALAQPTVDLSTLPVIFHLSNDSVDKIHKPVDISEIYRKVMTSPLAMLQTQNALEHLKEDALSLISKLPCSTPAPQILEDFIEVLS